nr:helix-turn-helix domain-containing protein [Corynebacterium oculi]
MLTTQEAADFLGVSRPTLVKLLEQEQLPCKRTSRGGHQRIRLGDVLSYRDKKHSCRREALDALTAEASGTGLYEAEPRAYEGALRQARRSL